MESGARLIPPDAAQAKALPTTARSSVPEALLAASEIEVEFARFLRPQLMRKVATDLGYGMSTSKEPSISNVPRDAWRSRLARSGDERILELFKRFFEHEKLKYHCLLSILTACGCVNEDLIKKSSRVDDAYAGMLTFFARLEVILRTPRCSAPTRRSRPHRPPRGERIAVERGLS
jgi:hypothetical protein